MYLIVILRSRREHSARPVSSSSCFIAKRLSGKLKYQKVEFDPPGERSPE